MYENEMNLKLAIGLLVAAIICTAGTALALSGVASKLNSPTVCPDAAHDISGLYSWTPVGTRSENFYWRCLVCGSFWYHYYPQDVYEAWRDAFLEPSFVRDYVLLYLKNVLELKVPDPLRMNWTGGRETPLGLLGYEIYVYCADDTIVTISYPVVLPKNTVYAIKVEMNGKTVWQGTLHQRRFDELLSVDISKTINDYYCGVGVFEKGIHVIATDHDPMFPDADPSGIDWQELKAHETTKASTKDFISLVISRGDFPTGGYTIQVKSFSWLEPYPLRLRFEVNFTNPGEGVAVTEAFTNPLVLVPLGTLSPGEYEVQVHIDTYILTYDENGNPVYTLIQTFKEELWTATFIVE
ncbi:protease complex subunit PrcB family protein [Candidatus Bathyarchaeota archaeon]|nr:protease complex subunit PrcB family protein [Candidatus Bathyarchaeota archaeon]